MATQKRQAGLDPVTEIEAYAVIIRACWCRGPDQADALAELKRRGLWLTDEQRLKAGLEDGTMKIAKGDIAADLDALVPIRKDHHRRYGIDYDRIVYNGLMAALSTHGLAGDAHRRVALAASLFKTRPDGSVYPSHWPTHDEIEKATGAPVPSHRAHKQRAMADAQALIARIEAL
jgi:hypothetical protein